MKAFFLPFPVRLLSRDVGWDKQKKKKKSSSYISTKDL